MRGKSKAVILVATISLLCMVSNVSCTKPKRKAVFILCDVASSLKATERQRVGELAGGVLDTLNNAEYIVSAIHGRKDIASDVVSSNLLLPKEIRDSEIQERLDSLAKEAEKPQPAERTSIFEAILSVAERLRQFPANDFEPHLVIISDMAEQSDKNPLGVPVNLKTKEAVTELTKLAEKFPCPANLKDMKVSIIIPAADDSSTKNGVSLEDLKPFWNALFKHCGFSDEAVNNMWHRNETPGHFSKPR
jgi:hypothetical protein